VATYNWSNLKVQFDNSSGTLLDMSAYVTAFGGIKFAAPTQDVTPAGSSVAANAWVKNIFAGIFNGADIQIDGVYDDTASTGPDVIFNDLGCKATAGGTRTLTVTYGGSKTTTIETIITAYDRNIVKGQPTTYTVTLTPTGAPTEV